MSTFTFLGCAATHLLALDFDVEVKAMHCAGFLLLCMTTLVPQTVENLRSAYTYASTSKS